MMIDSTLPTSRFFSSSMVSRMAVPAVITSSTITIRSSFPGISPTMAPPSPWSFFSLRLKQTGTRTPYRLYSAAAVTATRVIPL